MMINEPGAFQICWAHTRWGANGMLYIEAIFAVLAIVLFLIVQAAMRGKKGLSLEILTVTQSELEV